MEMLHGYPFFLASSCRLRAVMSSATVYPLNELKSDWNNNTCDVLVGSIARDASAGFADDNSELDLMVQLSAFLGNLFLTINQNGS